MADYYSCKEAELQRIKNDENEKAEAKRLKQRHMLKIRQLGGRHIQGVHGTY